MRLIALWVFIALPISATAQPMGVRVSQGFFTQAVSIILPFANHSGEPDFSEVSSTQTNAIIEWVPAGETVFDWTQMITVTALSGAGLDGKNSRYPVTAAAAMLNRIGGRFQEACDGAHLMPIEAQPIANTRNVEAAVVVCERVTGQNHGELAVILAVVGMSDLYTVQWAQRFPGMITPENLPSPEVLLSRLRLLGDTLFCPLNDDGSPAHPCN